MEDMNTLINEIKDQYGPYLTQREFMEAAGISSRTAYLATKYEEVPYQTVQEGLIRYYRIKAEDVAQYIMLRKLKGSTAPETEKERLLSVILASEPDVLSIMQTSAICGMHKNSITKWIKKCYLPAFRWKGDYRISKYELIRYMSSRRYWEAKSKCLQRKALKLALEWLKEQHKKYKTGVEKQ